MGLEPRQMQRAPPKLLIFLAAPRPIRDKPLKRAIGVIELEAVAHQPYQHVERHPLKQERLELPFVQRCQNSAAEFLALHRKNGHGRTFGNTRVHVRSIEPIELGHIGGEDAEVRAVIERCGDAGCYGEVAGESLVRPCNVEQELFSLESANTLILEWLRFVDGDRTDAARELINTRVL